MQLDWCVKPTGLAPDTPCSAKKSNAAIVAAFPKNSHHHQKDGEKKHFLTHLLSFQQKTKTLKLKHPGSMFLCSFSKKHPPFGVVC